MTLRNSLLEKSFLQHETASLMDDDEIRYCKHCLEYGFQVSLRNRLYPDNQIAIDHENWKQCYQCGSIYPVNELQKESKIKDIVETVDNPHDFGKSEFLAVDVRRRRKRLEQFDDDGINDEDVKRELRQGRTLLSYSEEIPQ